MNISVAEAKSQVFGARQARRGRRGDRRHAARQDGGASDAAEQPSLRRRSSLNGAMAGKIWIADDFDELGPEWDEYVK